MDADTPDVACDGWDGSECEGTIHCPPRCPRFVDKHGDRWTVRFAEPHGGEPYDDDTEDGEPHDGEPNDADRLLEMYEAFGTGDRAQGIPPANPDRRVDWVDSLLADGSNVLAERNGRVRGHAVYTPLDADRPEIAVFVHPDTQGRGVGTELCRQLIADAAAGDREALVLHVETGNHVARTVYDEVGFRTVERNGDLRMELPLDDPVATEVRWPPVVREGPVEPAAATAPEGSALRRSADDSPPRRNGESP